MKIIKNGTERKIKCHTCNSVLKYNVNDINVEDEYGFIINLYVTCPVCGDEIDI